MNKREPWYWPKIPGVISCHIGDTYIGDAPTTGLENSHAFTPDSPSTHRNPPFHPPVSPEATKSLSRSAQTGQEDPIFVPLLRCLQEPLRSLTAPTSRPPSGRADTMRSARLGRREGGRWRAKEGGSFNACFFTAGSQRAEKKQDVMIWRECCTMVIYASLRSIYSLHVQKRWSNPLIPEVLACDDV